MTINVTEEINYVEDAGHSEGHITIKFSGLPDVHFVLQALSKFCDKVRAGQLQSFVSGKAEEVPKKETKAKAQKAEEKAEEGTPGETRIFQADEEPKKKLRVRQEFEGKLPRIEGRVSSWEYRAIKATLDLDELLRDWHRRFPNSKIPQDKLKEMWIYYHPKGNAKRELETPAPRTEDDPAPGKQIGVGSRVVQVNGFAPAAGIGKVVKVSKDNQCTVEFFNHTKVLDISHFALATADDVRKARAAVINGSG